MSRVSISPRRRLATSGPYALSFSFTCFSDHVPPGSIAYEYTSLNPDKHVGNTLAAVKRWKAPQTQGSH